MQFAQRKSHPTCPIKRILIYSVDSLKQSHVKIHHKYAVISTVQQGYFPGNSTTGFHHIIKMSTTPSKSPTWTLVSTAPAMRECLSELDNLDTPTPSLFVDLEGIDLCRHGSISIMTIYALPLNRAYIIDVHSLRAAAFETPSSTDAGKTLKSILESPSILKAFFDVRNDSDALFAHFNVALAGVVDIQLLQLAATGDFSGACRYIRSLSHCAEVDLRIPMAEKMAYLRMRDAAKNLYDPKRGGSWQVFNARPLKSALVEYCVQDVVMFSRLYDVYSGNIQRSGNGPYWRGKVRLASANRVKESQTASFNPHGNYKRNSPWNFGQLSREFQLWLQEKYSGRNFLENDEWLI